MPGFNHFIGLLFILALASPSLAQFKITSKSKLHNIFLEHSSSLSEWLKKLNEEEFDFLCFGETHNAYFRTLEAEKIIPFLDADMLAVEEDNAKLQSIGTVHPFQVTGQPFAEVAAAFYQKNPLGQIVGIEANQEQKAKITFAQLDQLKGLMSDQEPSRDSAIAENLQPLLQTQNKVVGVYGANHCSYYSQGLGRDVPFVRILEDHYAGEKKFVVVHTVLPEEQSILKIYLREFGLLNAEEDFVLFNTRQIDPQTYNYNFELFALLSSYDVLIFPTK